MMAIMLERIGFNNSRLYMGIFPRSIVSSQRSKESDPGLVPFFEQKNQGLSRTPFSAKKSLASMSFLVLPQHKQFHPEGLSVFSPFMQLRIWVG